MTTSPTTATAAVAVLPERGRDSATGTLRAHASAGPVAS